MRTSTPMTPGSWTRQPLGTLWKMGGLAGDYLAPPQMTLVPGLDAVWPTGTCARAARLALDRVVPQRERTAYLAPLDGH